MGISSEVPGKRYRSILDPYRDSARVIEESDLDCTIIRPEWLNDRDEIDYGTTLKGEPFRNPSATPSCKSVADLVVRLATTPGRLKSAKVWASTRHPEPKKGKRNDHPYSRLRQSFRFQ